MSSNNLHFSEDKTPKRIKKSQIFALFVLITVLIPIVVPYLRLKTNDTGYISFSLTDCAPSAISLYSPDSNFPHEISVEVNVTSIDGDIPMLKSYDAQNQAYDELEMRIPGIYRRNFTTTFLHIKIKHEGSLETLINGSYRFVVDTATNSTSLDTLAWTSFTLRSCESHSLILLSDSDWFLHKTTVYLNISVLTTGSLELWYAASLDTSEGYTITAPGNYSYSITSNYIVFSANAHYKEATISYIEGTYRLDDHGISEMQPDLSYLGYLAIFWYFFSIPFLFIYFSIQLFLLIRKLLPNPEKYAKKL